MTIGLLGDQYFELEGEEKGVRPWNVMKRL